MMKLFLCSSFTPIYSLLMVITYIMKVHVIYATHWAVSCTYDFVANFSLQIVAIVVLSFIYTFQIYFFIFSSQINIVCSNS